MKISQIVYFNFLIRAHGLQEVKRYALLLIFFPLCEIKKRTRKGGVLEPRGAWSMRGKRRRPRMSLHGEFQEIKDKQYRNHFSVLNFEKRKKEKRSRNHGPAQHQLAHLGLGGLLIIGPEEDMA